MYTAALIVLQSKAKRNVGNLQCDIYFAAKVTEEENCFPIFLAYPYFSKEKKIQKGDKARVYFLRKARNLLGQMMS